MSDKTNDEKLKILQERLAQIKQKRETTVPPSNQKEEVIEITTHKEYIPPKERAPMSFGWVKYVVIIGALGCGAFFAYNNIDNLFLGGKSTVVLKYNLNMPGEKIAITGSFENESAAKAMVKDLKVKGYKCDYFFLPDKSNSKEEVYKVFIGPYENEEETNQWVKNLEVEFEIVKL